MGVTTIRKMLPTKHRNKPVNDEQDASIIRLQQDKGFRTYLEAKHEYFENNCFSVSAEDIFDEEKNPGLKLDAKSIIENEKISKKVIEMKGNKPKEAKVKIEKPKAEKKIRQSLMVDETKLGATMVLSKEDCKALGFKGSSRTSEVIQAVRQKLGLVVKTSSA